jgi:demethylmenaquinone methyltransferase / 2-methoxy-6-polyprenyl-1,4-benzoquinol methylase
MAPEEERDPRREHARRIRAMFGRIAGRYDLMNRLITFGRDQAWRRAAAEAAAVAPRARVLDLATGTGVLARAVLALQPSASVVGADFALPMLRRGLRTRDDARFRACQADALALPFPDGMFDAVLSGFLMRNVGDLDLACAEQLRVVRPGGRVVCLESSPARPGPLRPIARFYMRRVMPLLARLVAGDAPAYKYLAESTCAFLAPEALARAFERAGARVLSVRTFMCGQVALHTAEKPREGSRA